MSDIPNPKDAAELLVQLRRSEEISHRRVEEAELKPEKAVLRSWQSQRLETTHADLLASKRYHAACQFFLDDIYAPKDFSQRNHDIVRIHDFMLRFLPAAVLGTLTKAIALNNLTEELDEALLQVLVDEVGMEDSLSAEQYAEAYRICDNQGTRKIQIDMTYEVGKGIERLVRFPLIGWTLKLARRPAHRGGWYEMQGFLERGYAAFKRMGAAEEFLSTVRAREMEILDQIFADDQDPFQI